PIPNVLTLPETYPDTWVFAADANFFSIIDGKMVLLDVASKNRNYKGQFSAGQMGNFLQSTKRPELYVAETFYSRRLRGERTDVITIRDTVNLAPIAEIILPGGKRGQLVTHKHTFRFLDDEERLVAIFNFTPSASVTIIDIVARKVLGEAQIAGCSMIYPTGKHSFSSLCSDGAMLVTHLTADGKVEKQERTKAFFDIDKDALFAKAVWLGDMAYFPSFQGMVQPVDFSGEMPVIKESWSMISDADKKESWRPGGWQIASSHPNGKLYFLMHPGGVEGSHKGGGIEVWVYDSKTKQRVSKWALKVPAVSIEVTRNDEPYLVTMNANLSIDVYKADSGEFVREIGGRAVETPFAFFAVR
ncbi:MAG: amine dehydrogenase large subunit, partial [Pseudomonadota bacterium]